jgi:hypothetical protein
VHSTGSASESLCAARPFLARPPWCFAAREVGRVRVRQFFVYFNVGDVHSDAPSFCRKFPALTRPVPRFDILDLSQGVPALILISFAVNLPMY